METNLPFIQTHLQQRQDIHASMGGKLAKWHHFTSICFIFSGKSGSLHGYQDGWDNELIFSYTGEDNRVIYEIF
jgi:hypothetical protein